MKHYLIYVNPKPCITETFNVPLPAVMAPSFVLQIYGSLRVFRHHIPSGIQNICNENRIDIYTFHSGFLILYSGFLIRRSVLRGRLFPIEEFIGTESQSVAPGLIIIIYDGSGPENQCE
jgi:hypothetical protein